LGLLGDDECNYDAPQNMLWPSPPEGDMEVLVEDCIPPGISKEEAIQIAIQDSELIECRLP
jgi:hypothetical protein